MVLQMAQNLEKYILEIRSKNSSLATILFLNYNESMAKISELIEKKSNLYLVKTNKYKNVSIYLKFAFEYSEDLKAKLNVLSAMLTEISENYPTKESMNKKKDMLYGFVAACGQSNTGNLLVFTINYDFINPRFLNDVKEEDFIELIDETLYHPYFTQDFFNETLRNIKASIERNFDVPSFLASENFIGEVAKDYPRFKINSTNIIDILDTLTLKDIIDTYKSLFNTRIDIFMIGDYSSSLENYFSNLKSKKELYVRAKACNLMSRNEIDYQKDVSQSTLIVSYTVPYVRTDEEFYAFNLANIMFGGIPSSLLFSEVREKYSLCYSIFAKAYRYDGLVIVKTNIDANNKEKALEEIRKQLKRLKNLEFDNELLDVAKLMLINSALSINDDLDYLVDYVYSNSLNNINISVNDYIKKIQAVSLDNIKEVVNNYNEYLVYFLKGDKHE